MKYVKTFESFLNEKFIYPEGVKETGDKILDKFAKLIHSPSSTVSIMTWAVQGRNVLFEFGSGPETFSVEGYGYKDHYMINCRLGSFKLMKSDVEKAKEIYDEVESILQAGEPKRSEEIKRNKT